MVFLMLTLNIFKPFSHVSIGDFEQAIVSWIRTQLTLTCSNSTREILERDAKYVQSYQSKHQNDIGVFIVFVEHISHIFLVFLLLTLDK